MKRFPSVHIFEFLLFCALIVGVFLCVLPASRFMQSRMEGIRDTFVSKIENGLGVSVSYRSMSPSIFRSIVISDLVLGDTASGTEIASFSKVSITFSFLDLIRGRYAESLREISVMNGTVSVDMIHNKLLLEKLKTVTSAKDTENAGEQTGAVHIPALSGIKLVLTNILVTYSNNAQKIEFHLRNGRAVSSDAGIRFELDNSVRFSQLAKGSFSSDLQIRGLFSPEDNTGSAFITISNTESSVFRVSHIRLVASWHEGLLAMNTVQDLQPVDIGFLWDSVSSELSLSFAAERLLPFRWIEFNENLSTIKQLRDTELTGSASLTYNPRQKLKYVCDLEASIPESFLGGGKTSMVASGDRDILQIEALSVNGPEYRLLYQGVIGLNTLAPEGVLSIGKFRVPGGNYLSGTMNLDATPDGFSCSIPSLNIGSSQYNSVFLTITGSSTTTDYSLTARDETGFISSEGTITRSDAGFFQGYIACDSIDVGNLIGCAVSDLKSKGPASNLRLTTEAYISSDFTGFSFNCTKVIIASELSEGMYLLFAANGNESAMNVNDIHFSGFGSAASGDVSAFFDKNGDILFDSTIQINTLPYTFNGMYSDGNLSLMGEYGFSLSLFRGNTGTLSGSLQCGDFPILIGKALLTLSLDASVVSDSDNGMRMLIHEGKVEELNGVFPLETSLTFSGNLESTGLMLDRLTLTDRFSTVSGTAFINRTINSGDQTVLAGGIHLGNNKSSESFDADGRITLGGEGILDLEISAKEIPVARFLHNQEEKNIATFSFSCAGTPDNLVVSADLIRIQAGTPDSPLEIQGKIIFEQMELSVSQANVSWKGNNFSDLSALIRLDSLTGTADANFTRLVGKSTASANISVALGIDHEGPVSSFSDIPGLFNYFSAEARFANFRWNQFSAKEPVTVTLVREPGITAVYAGKDDLVSGYLLDDGTFTLQANAGSPVVFAANGYVGETEIALAVEGFKASFADAWLLTGNDLLEFPSGIISGNFTITGVVKDPEYYGNFTCTDFRVRVPDYAEQTFGPMDFEILANGKQLVAPAFLAKSSDGDIELEAEILFDRWLPSNVTLKSRSFAANPVKVNAKNDYFSGSAFIYHELVLNYDFNTVSLIGSVNYENGFFALNFANMMKDDDQNRVVSEKYIELDINIGKKVEFLWPTSDFPIINGLVQADEPIRIFYDTKNQLYSFTGNAKLRGGEVFYIKRSFYLRQGYITFNENQDNFDPLITFKAEMRERDEQGDPVRIILTVENQPISRFVPIFSSDPPKSEAELMALLGQVASGDTSRENLWRDTIVSTSDILTQMSLYRNLENSIRDFLQLDMFSIRTLVLQNALIGSSAQNEADQQMTIGNYFDNTTVYLGKYFGSAIYADALLHFSYYDPKSVIDSGNDYGVYNNLLIQPEIGFEVMTPLFLLRWAITPTSPESLFVTDNSVTLSWKFSY